MAISEAPDTRAFPRGQGDGWVVRLMSLADGLDRDLSDPRELSRLADRLIGVAEELGARSVVGASASGERLAGAVAARSAGRLRLIDGASTLEPVLIIETLMATGTQILATARALKQTGVTRIVGAALLADPVALETARGTLGGEVVTLASM
jgi:adenine/guanine phosphoribosyltransferase-like PRPP-binding protein